MRDASQETTIEVAGLIAHPWAMDIAGHGFMARTILTVFLSSTSKDLDAYRAEIRKRITAIDFLKCVVMEDFGPQNAAAVEFCRKKAKECDFFVGVVGLRRGWEPEGDNERRSITELEYGWAREAGCRQFMCIAPDDFKVAANLRDTDDEHERQQAFRARVGEEFVAGVHNFGSPGELAAEIVSALLSEIISGDLIKSIRPDLSAAEAAEAKPQIAAAVEKLAADKDVDLLALAKNPSGIDPAELEAKLKARAEQHEAAGNAAQAAESKKAAEYWRHLGALAFLNETNKAVDAYRKATALDRENADGWTQLGQLMFRLGDLDDAIAAFDRVLSIGEKTGSMDLVAVAASNLGVIHRTRGNLNRAEAMHRRSLAIEELLGRKAGMASDFCNLGLVYQRRGDHGHAEAMFCKSLEIFKGLGDETGMAASTAILVRSIRYAATWIVPRRCSTSVSASTSCSATRT